MFDQVGLPKITEYTSQEWQWIYQWWGRGWGGTTVPIPCNSKWCCGQKVLQKQALSRPEHQCRRHLLDGGLELLTQNGEHRDEVITEGLYCRPFKQRRGQASDISGRAVQASSTLLPILCFSYFQDWKDDFQMLSLSQAPKSIREKN